tara:strand:+ start:583 stop:1263 length:681 start_codon:yes stop_codon:yes gene_type:complete
MRLLLLKLLFILFTIQTYALPQIVSRDFKIIDKNLLTDERYDLMKAYTKHHYNLDHANLIDPKMVVVHYTAIPSLELSMKAFEPVEMPSHRDRLLKHGRVNVGTHYMIDKKGNIYQLYPTTVITRHVIGFNHTAIGIELVSAGQEGLRLKQINAAIKLIEYLTRVHPSIEYLIGHMEYMNRTYDHFKLFLAKDESYAPSIKMDPGFETMKRIRMYLKIDYGLELKK